MTTIKITELEKLLDSINAEFVANGHYSCDYDDLPDDAQNEHEGITWGVQDTKKIIREFINTKK